MSDPVAVIVVLAAAYFIGAIPSGVIIGRLWRGVDIRSYGSGGSGATNVARTLGPRAGAAVFASDFGKGIIVAVIARLVSPDAAWLVALAGTVAVLGHMFPVYIRFKGGKGVATGFGALVVISPFAGVVALIGVAIAALTRYVSLGSIMGSSLSLALLVVLSVFELTVLGIRHDLWYLLFAIPVGLLIVWRHLSNIDRLAKGDESRLETKPTPRRTQRTH
ncbi:MAG: glycerol-3-phosphate 1-O-acyltransferase PlsY [Chloroflexi bacterium]|nr:glycerol-3-phosphate 1-O-acyltransferase PlsY [Chloroflexota bacterium]MCH7984027.1 glycerol-3-phosphate 1-O-acyltransferase PlsY [Chloroflexota bacterium]MCH8115271.1 glycerol-3-phosphate 1-O-acyltransferase PlsY [Chloroflexota bacterium]MCI0775279.1 glycerol-3-phosphate 1-O-acyltransferase PlsY [Chloroflexota bacterium]MCI0804815.1 glycerol-3-phosphate 1-O-acyltransferase PlsY [Chloroflexota bacterium]